MTEIIAFMGHRTKLRMLKNVGAALCYSHQLLRSAEFFYSMSAVIWSASSGIRKQHSLRRFFAAQGQLPCFKRITAAAPGADDIVVGWGNKPNTRRAQRFARQHQCAYFRLEDGFLAYAGHPAMGSERLSLIADGEGIYYDASAPSALENLCNDIEQWYTPEFCQRSENLIRLMTHSGLSKYNHSREPLPGRIRQNTQKKILLVDQVFNDMSVPSALADESSFRTMLEEARRAHPDAWILIKTHPDVLLGKKRGYFSPDSVDDQVGFVAEDCSVAELMAAVSEVYCVSSQLGFEALLYGKTVHCFGVPFYAGWGLTQDRMRCDRRRQTLTLEQLVAAALIRYPRYALPGEARLCEVEQVAGYLLEQQARADRGGADTCYAVGFSLWKRAFVRQFVGDMARRVVFTGSPAAALRAAGPRDAILVWGNKAPKLEQQARSRSLPFWRMEDGFVRSVGLGADLRRPSCLVIDTRGLYYRAGQPSDILTLLNTTRFDDERRARGRHLQTLLNTLAVTKYNLGYSDQVGSSERYRIRESAAGREIILVPGQFEADQSVQNSRGTVKSNYALLEATRRAYPEAFVLFKEHPDLYSGVRPGALGRERALEQADLYVTHVDMHELLQECDRVSTMTSLTGFEALIRNKPVHVWGSPFYAGWGLTTDELEFSERTAILKTEELVYTALVLYCRCFSWNTRSPASPEQVIAELARERQQWASGGDLSSTWLSRQIRKARYLKEAFFR